MGCLHAAVPPVYTVVGKYHICVTVAGLKEILSFTRLHVFFVLESSNFTLNPQL